MRCTALSSAIDLFNVFSCGLNVKLQLASLEVILRNLTVAILESQVALLGEYNIIIHLNTGDLPVTISYIKVFRVLNPRPG